MTIGEAISSLDSTKSNAFGTSEKINWLSELDWRIKREIIDTHEGGDMIPFEGYGQDIDPETVLLADAPWDTLYLRYLEAMVDYHNGETAKYANSHAMFNAAYADFAGYYNRTVAPIRTRLRFF